MQLYIMMNILISILNSGKTNAQKLAEKFEVSKRSIYRYINALSSSGIPVVTEIGRNGGIYIAPEYEIKNLFLSIYEMRFVYKLLEGKNDPCSTNLREKIEYLSRYYYTDL